MKQTMGNDRLLCDGINAGIIIKECQNEILTLPEDKSYGIYRTGKYAYRILCR